MSVSPSLLFLSLSHTYTQISLRREHTSGLVHSVPLPRTAIFCYTCALSFFFTLLFLIKNGLYIVSKKDVKLSFLCMLTRTLWYLQKVWKTRCKVLYLLGLSNFLEHVYRRFWSEREKKDFSRKKHKNLNLTFNWIAYRSRSLFLLLWNVFTSLPNCVQCPPHPERFRCECVPISTAVPFFALFYYYFFNECIKILDVYPCILYCLL